ncbi:MAG: radical SAM protein [Desulfatiglandales bacterium]
MPYVFGPVPSRRLGLSLGVDLIPPKTCTYDCLYCQVGRTTRKIIEPGPLVPVEQVRQELAQTLRGITPDVITFSGSGEPTLNAQIHLVIDFIRGLTDTKIAVLTNGSLLWRNEVRERILRADIIMPTLCSVFEKTYKSLHNPHRDLQLGRIVEGMERLREDYRGKLFLEVVLLKGYNDSDREIEALRKAVGRIKPDKVQLNTVVRPPMDARAISLDRQRLEDIKTFLGEGAEIIADVSPKHRLQRHASMTDMVLEMAKRRPVRESDVAGVLGVSSEEAGRVLKGLRVKGMLRLEEQGGDTYYVVTGSSSDI